MCIQRNGDKKGKAEQVDTFLDDMIDNVRKELEDLEKKQSNENTKE